MDVLKLCVDLCFKGGFFMIPLALVAIAALVMIVERLLYLRQNRIDGDRFHFELRAALKDNDLNKAITLAARTKGMVGRIIEEGLLRIQAGEKDVAVATEKIIHSEMSPMEKSRGWLVNFSQIAPLLGILGTVQGMIVVFMKIEQVGSADPKLLAGGIYIALITTVAGLIIALPVTVAQEYIRTETNKILHFLDLYLIEIREWVDRRNAAE